jgi:hypothetical protein
MRFCGVLVGRRALRCHWTAFQPTIARAPRPCRKPCRPAACKLLSSLAPKCAAQLCRKQLISAWHNVILLARSGS